MSDIRDHQTKEGASLPNRAGIVLRPDFVCITGDLAWSGREQEYEQAVQFVDELQEIIRVPKDRVFIVPGNHDVNRGVVEDDFLYQAAFDKLSNPNQSSEDLYLELKRAWPLRAFFAAKLQNFASFLRLLGKSPAANLAFLERVEVGEIPIEILGINSSWMSCRDNEDSERRLLIGLPQVDELLEKIAPDVKVRIAMFHHPSTALHHRDVQTAYDLLTKRCPIVLHGHLHEQRIRYSKEPEREHLLVSAGATYSDRSRWAKNAYNYGVLDSDEGTITVYLRKATRGAEILYIRDVETYPQACDRGSYTWELDRLSPFLAERKERTGTTRVDVDTYLQQLLEKTSCIDIRGLGIGVGKAHSFPIHDLYVELKARTSDVLVSAEREDSDAFSETIIPLDDVLQQSHRTVIIGDPGFGKSTFLNRVANALCLSQLGIDPDAHHRLLGLGQAYFPILIRVSEFSEYLEAVSINEGAVGSSMPSTASSPSWLFQFLATYGRERNWRLDETYFQAKLSAGDCIVLLDGLDETPDRRMRRRVRHIIDEAVAVYKDCKFIVTTRPVAYESDSLLSGFSMVTVAGLGELAIKDFVVRWTNGLKGADTGETKQLRQELLTAINSREEIARMARNPVMLTALCVVHWNEKRIPEQRVELYATVINWLLRSRERRKNRASESETKRWLAVLAFAMQSSSRGRVITIPLREASEAIAHAFSGTSAQETITSAENFLLQEQVDSGIILARGNNVTFWHPTFMEYLAAVAIAGKPDKTQSEILFKGERAFHPEWQEVVLLHAGVLSTQGFDKVSQFLSRLLRVGDENADTRFRALGLVGAILQDLRPVGFSFEPPKLLNMVRKCTYALDRQDVLFKDRISAGLAIGYIGDERLKRDAIERSFIRIPPCGLKRGDDHGEPREHPSNFVKLSEYWIARYPVTNREFREFVDDGGYEDPQWWGGSRSTYWRWRLNGKVSLPKHWGDRLWNAPNLPVVGVSWYEAVAYTVWYTARCRSVTIYRLPTEAEWERVARGAHEGGRVFPWGDVPPDPHTNLVANYGDMGIAKTTPVGVFPATYPNESNEEKIYDLAGNVFDWCFDWFREGYEPGFHVNPTGPKRGKQRVVKGGSWYRSVRHLRCGYRGHAYPGERADTIGFRLVKVFLANGGAVSDVSEE